MNNRLNRLIHLHELKQEATKKAYLEFLDAQEEFKQNKLRHDQLLGYRKDYLQQLEVIGNQGTQVGRVRNRLDFIGHLDKAIVQINVHLSQIAKIRMRAEQNYKQAKTSEEGIAKLIERVKKTIERKEEHLALKESDEYAQKQWYTKNIHE